MLEHIPSWYKTRKGEYVDLNNVNIDEFVKQEHIKKVSEDRFPVFRNKEDVNILGKNYKIVKSFIWENDVLKYGYCSILDINHV